MKVGVIVITYNLSSEVFLLQMAAIRKYLTDDFVIEIFDNSNNLEMAEHIRYHAEQLGIKYTKTFSNSQNGSDSHSFAANLSYQRIKNDYSYYLYLDHDLIPVRNFSVIRMLENDKVMAGIGQGAKKKYFWPGCVMWNADVIDRGMIDFSYSHELGLDTGGGLYKIVDRYGIENCVFFNEAYHQNPNFVSNEYGYYTAINDGMFFHCVNASNWNGVNRHEERINAFINLVKEKTGL